MENPNNELMYSQRELVFMLEYIARRARAAFTPVCEVCANRDLNDEHRMDCRGDRKFTYNCRINNHNKFTPDLKHFNPSAKTASECGAMILGNFLKDK